MTSPEQFLDKGLAHHRLGELTQAAFCYRKIIRIDPGHWDALHLLGVVSHQRGENREAVALIQRAISLKGNAAAFHSNLGTACRELGRSEEAARCFRKAMHLDPDTAGYAYNLGNVLKDQGELQDAVRHYRLALETVSDFPEAWNNLGDALLQSGRLEDAIDSHCRAVELRRDFPEAWFNLGNAYRNADRLNEAADSYRQAVRFRPGYSSAWINCGYTYEDQGRMDKAVSCYTAAISIDPQSADAHFNRALAWLRSGEWSRGWAEYEWRFKRTAKERRRPSGREWDGSSLTGERVFVYSEQGIGDEIMFASCLPDLLQQNPCAIVVEADPRLLPLMTRSFPTIQFIARDANGTNEPKKPNGAAEIQCDFARGNDRDGTEADLQIAAGSLPRFFRSTLTDFPGARGYLQAEAALTAQWRERFRRLGDGITVGISWRGGRDAVVQRRRSTTLDQWSPLFAVENVHFVNLQYGDCREEIEAVRLQSGTVIHDWDDADPLRDLNGFAAQVAAVDLVISVDNATVHLAGALNVPVWTLLPFASDWRWLIDCEDSPWYPTMKLLRQPVFGDWQSLFQRAAEDLTEQMSSSGVFNGSQNNDASLVMDDPGSRIETADIVINPRDSSRSRQLNDRGSAALNAGSVTDAIDFFEKSIAADSGNAEAVNNLGVALQKTGRLSDALTQLQRAWALSPSQPQISFNLGNLYRLMNDLDSAFTSYERSLKIDPHHTQAAVNRGVLYRESGELAKAEAAFDDVLQRLPHLPEARFNRALVRLQRGDFAGGWPEYEWRWKTGEPSLENPAVPQQADICGRDLLIRAEQGIGDEILFVSCLPDVLQRANSCVVECDKRLLPLFARSFSSAKFVPRPSSPGLPISQSAPQLSSPRKYDVRIPCGSLPGLFRRSPDCFPTRTQYLIPDADRVAEWRRRVEKWGSGLKVGISWSGGKDEETRRRRSTDLNQWRTLLAVENVHFVNLQYGQSPADIARLSQRLGVEIHQGKEIDPLTNLDEFAALIAALDLVISVDNSTVHLAAAVGANVWTLLPFSADWRWIINRDDSLWYPQMRLFRQTDPGNWNAVLQRVTHELTREATRQQKPFGP